jgi:guanosine-3',5'-bis(diphosphate) 3'-pyrophosphohydrolase
MMLIERAKVFALHQHRHLFRPNKAQEPISVHLAEVADLVTQAGGCDAMIAAAWLHDVVEDTHATIEDIQSLFGEKICLFVNDLTDPVGFSSMPLQQRKQSQLERLYLKSNEIKIIKLADQISNIKSVLSDPPCDWTVEKCQI